MSDRNDRPIFELLRRPAAGGPPSRAAAAAWRGLCQAELELRVDYVKKALWAGSGHRLAGGVMSLACSRIGRRGRPGHPVTVHWPSESASCQALMPGAAAANLTALVCQNKRGGVTLVSIPGEAQGVLRLE